MSGSVVVCTCILAEILAYIIDTVDSTVSMLTLSSLVPRPLFFCLVTAKRIKIAVWERDSRGPPLKIILYANLYNI